MSTRIINLNDEITLTEILYRQGNILDAVQSDHIDKIIFQISSGGGDIAPAMSLFYWLNNLQTDKLEIHAFSHIASAANVLLLTKHPTYAYPHVSFMFHPCSAKLEFTAHSEQAVIANSSKRVDDYWALFSQATKGKINREWIMKKEHVYLYPKDLKKLGILNGVL